MGKKRRRKDELEVPPDLKQQESSDSDTAEFTVSAYSSTKFKDATDKKPQNNKYDIYKVKGYTRKYSEDSKQTELIVFLSHLDEHTVFSDKDRMALSKSIREHGVSGVMHLRTIIKYKVGVTFDLPNNAHMFLKNKKLLDQLSLKATIPAGDTEVTGVLTSVPVEMSNKEIMNE